MTKKINWNDENTAKLAELAGSGVVTQDQLAEIANEFDTSTRSIGSKLRNMGHEVEKVADRASAWTAEQEQALTALIESQPNQLTYAEIAATFENGTWNARQIQGKVLSLELFDKVRKAEKKVAQRTYSQDEEVRFVAMVNEGSSVEDLASAFGRPVNSIRGKALSLLRSGEISEMPKQAVSAAKERPDALEGLDVASMTVAEIAEKSGKTERGIKSILTRRKVTCADYDGEAKAAKSEAKNA